jgi:hypothetical protein
MSFAPGENPCRGGYPISKYINDLETNTNYVMSPDRSRNQEQLSWGGSTAINWAGLDWKTQWTVPRIQETPKMSVAVARLWEQERRQGRINKTDESRQRVKYGHESRGTRNQESVFWGWSSAI